ncbi:MAG: DUF4349 domain-containing protein [Acidimicrobiales bacterium]
MRARAHAPFQNRRRWPALLLALAALAGACGAQGDDAETSSFEDSSSGAAEEAQPATDDAGDVAEESEDLSGVEADGDRVEATTDAPSTGSGGAPAAIDSPDAQVAPDLGRQIIRTASVTVEVDDILVAGQEANTIIEGFGGLLFDQTTSVSGSPSSTLTFRVQPADFSEALDALAGVGVVLAQEVSATDVTERVVDLESRIITSEASVERLRAFLADATTLEAIAQIEAELLTRETDLELLRGQLRTLQNQVSLATITLHLTQPVPGPAMKADTTAYVAHDGGAGCPGLTEIDLTEGDDLTLCVEVTNTGDTHLGEFELTAHGFDVDTDDFVAVDPVVAVAPDETVRFYVETEAVAFRPGTVDIRARVVDAEGNDLRLGSTDAQSSADLDIDEDLTPPSFLEGLAGGWAALVALAQVAAFLLGVFLPFVWVPILAVVGWRWWKPRRAGRRAARLAAQPATPAWSASGPTPPPPAATPPPPAATPPAPAAAAPQQSSEPREGDPEVPS